MIKIKADLKNDCKSRYKAQTPIKRIRGTEQYNKTMNPLPLTNEIIRPMSDKLRHIIKMFTNTNTLSLLPLYDMSTIKQYDRLTLGDGNVRRPNDIRQE